MKRVALAVVLATVRSAAAEPSVISLGAHVAPQSILLEGDGPPGDLRGYALGFDAGYSLNGKIAIATAVEGSLYTRRSDRLPPGSAGHSLAALAELHLDTDMHAAVWAHIAIGTGFRWLDVPLASGPTDHVAMWEPLLVRVGPAWHASAGTQLAVLAGFGLGWITSRSRDGACAIAGSCADSLYDSDTQSPAVFIADLALEVRGWP